MTGACMGEGGRVAKRAKEHMRGMTCGKKGDTLQRGNATELTRGKRASRRGACERRGVSK
jgi:hypothetical protein